MRRYLDDIETLAHNMYDACCDMDCEDFKSEKEKEIQDLVDCLYHLKSICENEHNSDFFRTFANCLDIAFMQ